MSIIVKVIKPLGIFFRHFLREYPVDAASLSRYKLLITIFVIKYKNHYFHFDTNNFEIG